MTPALVAAIATLCLGIKPYTMKVKCQQHYMKCMYGASLADWEVHSNYAQQNKRSLDECVMKKPFKIPAGLSKGSLMGR